MACAPRAGDPAPDFELWTSAEQPRSLADLHGRAWCLTVFLKAGTPGCRRQLLALREAAAELRRHGVEPLAVSPDSPERLRRCVGELDLDFELLSDEDHQMLEHFGAWGLKRYRAKSFLGPIRATYLIDATGHLAGAWIDLDPEAAVAVALDHIRRTPHN